MKIVLHGSAIKSEFDFHSQIAKAMNFPSYYGKNLDALWDVLSADIERPITLIWRNSELSKQAMGDDFSKIQDILNKVQAQDVEWGLDEKFELLIE